MAHTDFEHWPEYVFRNKQKVGDEAVWAVYLIDRATVANTPTNLVCCVQGKAGAWRIPGYDANSSRDLGVFKKRKQAAATFLAETEYKPQTKLLNEKRENAWRTNALRPFNEPLSEAVANAIYEILVEECGAPVAGVTGQEYFVAWLTREPSGRLSEYRFQGMIGFGGKIYFSANQFYVSCYQEEETPYVNMQIAAANARLQALHVKTWGTR